MEKQNLALHYFNDSDSNKKIVSNYNNYSVELNNPGKYHIEIESLCSCIGFNKFLFIPLISLENENITAELTSTRMLEPTFSLPARLSRTWEIQIEQPRTLNFSIYSDNSNLDNVIYESSSMEPYAGNGYIGYVHVESEIKAGFKGKYLIKISGL